VTGPVQIGPVQVNIPEAETVSNTSVANLVAEINSALGLAGVAGNVLAGQSGNTITLSTLQSGTGQWLQISTTGATTLATIAGQQVAAPGPNAAVNELHYQNAQSASGADGNIPAQLVGAFAAPANGQLTQDTRFALSVNGANPIWVLLGFASTTANASLDDLAGEINAVFASVGLGSLVVAGHTGNLMTLTTLGGGAGETLQITTSSFGVFLDSKGNLTTDDNEGQNQAESTGYNRMLGSPNNDFLWGGNGLDFLDGNGGTDHLYKQDGTEFSAADGGDGGAAWKQYAKTADNVWYYSGTNADDVITVDYVTEPGYLQGHELITRLTNNNGNFSFDAQVRLDFAARDAAGNLIWDPTNLYYDVSQLASQNTTAAKQTLQELDNGDFTATNLTGFGGLLPPEGDYDAIIIDALGGNDTVTIGPTVQKPVWVDGGTGNDTITVQSGNTILPDQTEGATRNDTLATAYNLKTISAAQVLSGLTIDNPNDQDWYQFTLATALGTHAQGVLTASSISLNDGLVVEVRDQNGNLVLDSNGNPLQMTAGLSQIDLSQLTTGTTYYLHVYDNLVPTIYQLDFKLQGTGSTAVELSAPAPDQTETNGRNDTQASAFALGPRTGNTAGPITVTTLIKGLTIDSTTDQDWYSFQLAAPANATALPSGSTLAFANGGALPANMVLEVRYQGGNLIASTSPTSSIDLTQLTLGTTYFIHVFDAQTPTFYQFDFRRQRRRHLPGHSRQAAPHSRHHATAVDDPIGLLRRRPRLQQGAIPRRQPGQRGETGP